MVSPLLRNLCSDLDKILPIFLKWCVVLVSLIYVLVLLLIMSVRLVYPYELEWIEGAYVDEAHWVSQGEPIYGQPSIYYIPTSKTPLLFYLAALFIKYSVMGI